MGLFQSEQKFLSRTKEGLGSEIALIGELLKAQGGVFSDTTKKDLMTLVLELPKLGAKEGLRAVISSRVFETSTGVGSLALAFVKIPEKMPLETFQAQIRGCLFRSTDAAYVIPDMACIAIILNDCKPEDAPKMLSRIERNLQRKLTYGYVTCPEEGADPDFLIGLAERRMAKGAR
jgi:hypothetical protein